MSKFDVIIIGGGIVGLATAYQLQKQNPSLSLAVLEKEMSVGTQQTSHNSGVIHSGVYYPPGSLKAKNCLQGRKELISFCKENRIPFKPLGKVIVATEETELPNLEEIAKRGFANQIEGLELIGREKLKEIEPHAEGIKALWVPSCSIVDFSEVARFLEKNLIKGGAQILCSHPVKKIIPKETSCVLQTLQGDFEAKLVINCAGIFSDEVAKTALPNLPLQIIPFKGEYYQLSEEKKSLIKGLIYPVCDLRYPFLGIHFTPMMNGAVEIGPNAVLSFSRTKYQKLGIEWKEVVRIFKFPGFWKMGIQNTKTGLYEWFRSFSKKRFVHDAKKLVPSITEKDLKPGLIGLRAQVVSQKGEIIYDFRIEERKNMIHILNAPSPAATASFAIGKDIATRALAHFS